AAQTFTDTLTELEQVSDRLSSNFYPGGSGMGVETLKPIYESITRVRDAHKRLRDTDKQKDTDHNQKIRIDYDSDYADLGDLIVRALRHQSHEEWVHSTGHVERLIAELHLAFRWNEGLSARASSARSAAAQPSRPRTPRHAKASTSG